MTHVTATTGVVLVPSMVKTGYGAPFSTALVGAAAVLLIITPMILPIAAAGINPVHLGVIMSVNLSIGLITYIPGVVLFLPDLMMGAE